MSYQIPQLHGKDLELTLVIKNSHFIANLRHTVGRGECDIHLNDMRKKYPDILKDELFAEQANQLMNDANAMLDNIIKNNCQVMR